MQVEHLSGVILEGESLFKFENPESEKNDCSPEANLCEKPEEAKETS